MKPFLVVIFLVGQIAYAQTETATARILCFDRFEDEIWEMTGQSFDDKGCRAMLIAGTVGVCFEGDANSLVEQMNAGSFEYSDWQKVNKGTASLLHEDVIEYGSYEGDFVGWTRSDNLMFRCPAFDQIKTYTTQLADDLKSSVDYAVSRRYFEEFGLPFWLDAPAEE